MSDRHYSKKTLGSYKRTFNLMMLQITERRAAGPATPGGAGKITGTALVLILGSAFLERHLGVSLLP